MNTSSDTSGLVLGTWKILKDSVVNNNYVSPGGGYLIPGVYIGKAGDFWKFDGNGNFTMLENNISGGSTYSIQTGKLDIPGWTYQYGMGTFDKITSSILTVHFAAATAYGNYYRKVYLKR